MNKIFVMALGGSIICPDGIDVSYLKNFYDFIVKEIAAGKKFIIVTGGGNPARQYQRAAGEIVPISDQDKDWLGIHATRLNAHLLRTIFAKQAHPVILEHRGKIIDFDGYSVIIAAGWRPGWSTDFVAVQIAVDFNVDKVLILGKPDFVYNKDNQRFSDATPFTNLTWQEYLKLIPNEWSPGIHAPVDPVAAKLARQEGIEVIVADGKNLENLKNILEERKFKGTMIK
ncbi:MAG: uridylate kinase [Parcubacteria group bacterium LiPW_39]|nr:MAG: uridylate kinase [Parcubacteria group bacterium LiPW_39]